MENPYTRAYYELEKNSARTSAEVIAPLVMRWVSPTSVIDLGCGVGSWLAVFKEAGVQEIHGVDGDYIQRDQLAISEDAFTSYDLANPYVSGRSYDMAMSLEVAGRLPPEAAQLHVHSLTNLAPVVLFSSAIPHQPGDNDVNQQWPVYWADLFAQRGYVVIDALRFEIWEDSRIGWWYRQNIMFYAHKEHLKHWPALEAEHLSGPARPLQLIHPEMFQLILEWGLEQSEKYWNLYSQ
jgi:hypothetical protein